VLERALDALLEKLEKQRFAQTNRPAPARRNRQEPPPRRVESAIGQSLRRESEPNHEPESGRSEDFGPSASNASEAITGAAPATPEGQAIRRAPEAHTTPKARTAPKAQAIRRAPEAQGMRRARREHVPNEIRRAIAMRDEFQCTYVDGEGRRCQCRAFLQLHHEQAHALGGPSTVQNLRLLCGPHNRLLAERDFGRTPSGVPQRLTHQEQCTRRSSSGVPQQAELAEETETVREERAAPEPVR